MGQVLPLGAAMSERRPVDRSCLLKAVIYAQQAVQTAQLGRLSGTSRLVSLTTGMRAAGDLAICRGKPRSYVCTLLEHMIRALKPFD
jgi:hypothetical protein